MLSFMDQQISLGSVLGALSVSTISLQIVNRCSNVQVIGSKQTPEQRGAGFASAFAEIEASRWLPLGLLAAGTLSAVVTPHAPLAAFAAASGVLLRPRRAVAVALLIWLIDQASGLGLRGYPLEQLSVTWALVMGSGTVAVALLASQGPGLRRRSWSGHALWSLLALVGGFLLYQSTIVLVYPVIVDGHTMGADVITGLLRQQLAWGGALMLGHGLWMQSKITQTASISPAKSPGEPGL